jgi:3'(2'), 5'-bisphosphate nucleotidase
VADYSAQAVVNTILSHAFPDQPIVGEEDSADLRATGESAVLRACVVELADDTLVPPPLHTTTSGSGGEEDERAEWGVGMQWGAEALLEAIDRGSYASGRSGRTYEPLGWTSISHPLFFF